MNKQRKAINTVTPAHRDRSLNDRPGEKWLPIPHLEKFLLISNHGRIKRLERISVRFNGVKCVLKEMIMLPAVNKSYNKFRDDYIHALQLETKIEGKFISFQVHRMVYYCFVEPFDLNDKDIVIKIADGGLDIRPQMLLRLNQKGKAQRMYETGRQKSPFSFDDFKSKLEESPSGNLDQPVSQYDHNGILQHTYNNITEATECTGIKVKEIRHAAKWLVCLSKGYYWRYGTDKLVDVNQIREIMLLDEVKTLADAYRYFTGEDMV